MRGIDPAGAVRTRTPRASSFSLWRLADAGVGAVVGMICAGLSYAFLDSVPVWWHGLIWLLGFVITVVFARPLSTSM